MDACLGHILKSTKGIEMKLGLYINNSKRRAVSIIHNPTLYIYWVISTLPFSFIMDACLGHIFESTKGIEMKLGL